jgi:hypothetical protein
MMFVFVVALFCLCLGFVFSSPPQKHETIQCDKKDLLDVTDAELSLVKSVKMAMLRNEQILLLREMKNAKVYAEWGCGGSTELACRLPHLEKIITIDSSKEFLDGLINNSTCLKDNSKIFPIHVNIGPTGHWGTPQDNTFSDMWSNYPNEITKVIKSSKPDFYLVDGRFRIACALRLLLEYRNEPTRLRFGIHDFFWRKVYHVILRYTTIADCIDFLVILKPKEGLDFQLIEEEFQKYSKKFD